MNWLLWAISFDIHIRKTSVCFNVSYRLLKGSFLPGTVPWFLFIFQCRRMSKGRLLDSIVAPIRSAFASRCFAFAQRCPYPFWTLTTDSPRSLPTCQTISILTMVTLQRRATSAMVNSYLMNYRNSGFFRTYRDRKSVV